MNKVVTFGSPEYFELLALGWFVLAQVSASVVMMAHPAGTAFANPGGLPQTNVDRDEWKPHWSGTAIPGLSETPVNPHVWTETNRTTSPIPEVVILYADTANPQSGLPGGYLYFKLEVLRSAVLFWTDVYYQRWDDANGDYSLRRIATALDTWVAYRADTIHSPPETIRAEWLVATVAGSVQYRVRYGSGVIHNHPTFSSANAEYDSA